MSRKSLVLLGHQDLGRICRSLITGDENGKIRASFSSTVSFFRHLHQPHRNPGNPILSFPRRLHARSDSKGDIFLGLVYLAESPKWTQSWWVPRHWILEDLGSTDRMSEFILVFIQPLSSDVSGLVLSTQYALLNKTDMIPALREPGGGTGIERIIIRVMKGKYQMLQEEALGKNSLRKWQWSQESRQELAKAKAAGEDHF